MSPKFTTDLRNYWLFFFLGLLGETSCILWLFILIFLISPRNFGKNQQCHRPSSRTLCNFQPNCLLNLSCCVMIFDDDADCCAGLLCIVFVRQTFWRLDCVVAVFLHCIASALILLFALSLILTVNVSKERLLWNWTNNARQGIIGRLHCIWMTCLFCPSHRDLRFW